MAVHGRGCPGCGGACGGEDRFCRVCGRSLAAEASFPERRHVTAMFSDLCGYTALAGRLELEDLRAFMDPIFHEAARIIESFGGTVENFLGDAVLALFGVRQARDDDPVRAVRAAFLLHGFVRDECRLAMHTGIHSGTVLVHRGRPGTLIPRALGLPINIAARLSGLASPDEILLGGGSVPGAGRFYTTEPLGAKSIKGLAFPVAVHRVVSPAAALSAPGEGGETGGAVSGQGSVQSVPARAFPLAE